MSDEYRPGYIGEILWDWEDCDSCVHSNGEGVGCDIPGPVSARLDLSFGHDRVICKHYEVKDGP